MKTSAWIVAAGVAMGLVAAGSMPGIATRALAVASAAPEKVDLTPKYKQGDKLTFKQKTVRKDTMTIGAMGGDDGKDAPKGDAPKGDAPKGDAPKGDAPKNDAAKSDAVKSDAAKSDTAKSDTAKTEPPKDEKPAATPQGIVQSASGMSSTQSIDQTAMFELRVVEASETGALFELELKSLTASAELAQGKFSWDSTAPEEKEMNNPVMAAFRPIVGAIARIKTGPDGNILSVDTDPRLNINMRSSLAPNAQALVGSDGIRLRWGSVVWFKDGKAPATVGDTWNNSDTTLFPAVGRFTYDTTNTLKGVKDGVADIGIKGEIKVGPIAPDKPAQGKISEQHITGSCQWDTAKGLCKSHTWEQKQVLNLNAGGFPVTRSSEFTVTTTRE